MTELKIISNHHKIPVIYWYELTEKDKLEFDWIINNASDPDDFTFFRYKDNIYCLSDFMRIDNNGPFPKYWNGYSNDTFFSGILIKYPYNDSEFDNTDFIIVGSFYS